jgi:signal peptidase I
MRSVLGALLSLVAPGAGHFLVGRFARGIVWVVLLDVLTLSIPFTKALGLLGVLVLRIAAALDVSRVRAERPAWKILLAAWAGLIVWSAASTTLVRGYVTQAFTIPSGAMMDTLLAGDYVMTDNVAYRFGEPRRSDIVVFEHETDDARDFIKRIVALPGEVVQVRGHHVYINGAPLDEPYARRDPAAPGTGACAYAVGCEPTIVPPRSYFVMGDNRAASADSRSWGFIKREKIRGKAFLVYWSWDRNTHGVRWARLGRTIP